MLSANIVGNAEIYTDAYSDVMAVWYLSAHGKANWFWESWLWP